MGDLVRAAAGYDLKIVVRIELGSNPPEEVVVKVNKTLEDMSDDLEVK